MRCQRRQKSACPSAQSYQPLLPLQTQGLQERTQSWVVLYWTEFREHFMLTLLGEHRTFKKHRINTTVALKCRTDLLLIQCLYKSLYKQIINLSRPKERVLRQTQKSKGKTTQWPSMSSQISNSLKTFIYFECYKNIILNLYSRWTAIKLSKCEEL